MNFSSLRDFIEFLEKKGDLVRVKAPVSTELEMTEIQTRVLAEGGPAILFENVKGHDMPVLVNLFGTVERVAQGMGTTKDGLRELGETLAFLKTPEPPGGWREAFSMLPLVKKLMASKPKEVKKAPCQEIILTGDDIDLAKLPIQTCWPGEPAPLITWPLIVTQGPDPKGDRTDSFNLGIYRMQVVGKNQTIMRWLKHRGGAEHHRKWKEKELKDSVMRGAERRISPEPAEPRRAERLGNLSGKKQFPAAAVLGCDPGIILAAVTPIPDTVSEYQFAGLLRGEGVELVDCKTIPLKVPAAAEIILEGHVSLDEYMDEGPYGDHTGYYNSVEQFPVFTISAITCRKKPIYLSTYTGRSPDEPSILGEALNDVFVPLLIQQFPEIVDFWLPPEGCSYRIAVVSIKKSYPGHAKRIMLGIWSFLRQFIYTKWVIVVDSDINVRDWKDVMWAISTRMDFGRDITVIENTPIDYLDFASPESGLGAKLGFDATNKIPPETTREWGKEIRMDQNIIDEVTSKWAEYGLPGSGKPIWKK